MKQPVGKCYENGGYINDGDISDSGRHAGKGEKIVNGTISTENTKEVPSAYSNLLRCSQRQDVVFRIAGLALAVIAGVVTPLTNLAYSEAVNMMMDSQHPNKEIATTPMLLIDLIGGSRDVGPNATQEERMDALAEYLINRNWFMIGMNVMQLFTAAAAVALLKMASYNQARRIREQLFSAAMRHDMTWFDVKGGHNIAANLNEDVAHIENGVGSTIAMMTLFLVNILVGLFISGWLSWKLTLVVGTLVPLNMFLVFIITHFQNGVALKEVEISADAGNVFSEAIAKIRTVASFGGEKKEIAKYDNLLKQSSAVAVKRGVYLGCVTSVTWIFNYGASIVAFIYGAQLLQEGESVFVISMVLASIWIVTIRFGSSFPLLQKIATAVGSSVSVFSTIDSPRGIDPMAEGGIITSSLTGRIDFRNVHFRYPARPEVSVLNGVNFFIRPGETVAIVGPSGSGKSTILQLLQRFYDPYNGSIDLEGVNLKMLNVAWVRQQIGVVGQEAALFAGTIWENIHFGLMTATNDEIIAAAKLANAHDFIMNLHQGYETVIGSKGATLSGGEKQRIAIARALVRNPRILLLDEPTSALDAASREIVQAALKSACKGRTTLMVTHRLASTKMADRIIVIDGGRVVEEGTHPELMARGGIYSQMSLCEDKLEEKGNNASGDHDVLATPERLEATNFEKKSSTVADKVKSGVPFHVLLLWNKPELWLLIGGFIASAISGALMPIGAVVYGEFISSFSLPTIEEIQRRVTLFSLIEVVVLTVMALSMFLVVYLFTVTRERLTIRLKIRAFSSIIQQELGWFDRAQNHVGALYSRVSRDVTLIHEFTGPGVGTIIQAIFNLSLGFAISMYYSWKLTLMTELIIPFLFMGPVLEGIMSKKEDSLEMAHLETACTIATEAMSNKHVVTSLGLEKVMIERYNEALEVSTWRSKVSAVTRGLAFGMAQSLPGAAYAICFAYGGVLMRDDNLPFESVVKVSEILLIGAWTVASELVFTASYTRAQDAAGRLQGVFTRTSAIKGGTINSVNNPPSQSERDKISYSKICMSYPTRPNQPILQDLDLGISEGESVGVIGPSGSGKSSILHLLQRLYVPSNGTISFHGTDIQDLALPAIRHQLGLVSQEPTLFSGTIRENIAYGDNTRDVSMEEIISAAKKANIHNFIVELPSGYETMLGKSAQLSGGQKQRIAIARALVRDPKVLLLDEATSALDPESERLVQEALNLAAKGRTTITIAHRMGAVAHADRILRLEGGRIFQEKLQTRL